MLPTWIFSLLWLLLAGVLISLGDHLLRRQENLIASLPTSPVIVPFSEYLQDQVRFKTQWNGLLAARDAAFARKDPAAAAAATYALCQFAADFDALDRKRRDVLLDLIDRYGDTSDAKNAYFLLLKPEWTASLGSSHPQFVQKLLDLGSKAPDGGLADQLALSDALRDDHETALELTILKTIQEKQPISLQLGPSMNRLLELLPPSDPDLAKVRQEVAAIAVRHDTLVQQAKWYQTFEAARQEGKPEEMTRLRAALPPMPTDSFVASADAHLADADMVGGQFLAARIVRENLARFDPRDISDCIAVGMELNPPMNAVNPLKTPRKSDLALMALPDEADIAFNRWRGLMYLGRHAEAKAMATAPFTGTDKRLVRQAAALAAASRGEFGFLSPVAIFKPQTEGLPPEMAGQRDVFFVAMDLKPTARGIPVNIHARLEMWISRDLILQVMTTDEPRNPRPRPVVTHHDEDPWWDEYFEFFLSPDAWFNFYYQWAVTSSGVTWDARRNLVSAAARMQFTTDKSVELALKATASQTPAGWMVRMVMPRALVIPPGPAVVRFNARRKRRLTDKNNDPGQFYGWVSIPASDHQPDRFGWLIIPQ